MLPSSTTPTCPFEGEGGDAVSGSRQPERATTTNAAANQLALCRPALRIHWIRRWGSPWNFAESVPPVVCLTPTFAWARVAGERNSGVRLRQPGRTLPPRLCAHEKRPERP